MKKSDFPVYRKYVNESAYFKVMSTTHWQEIRLQPGGKWELHDFEAKILTDRNFVADIIEAHDQHWSTISSEEYENVLKKVNHRLQ